jgi:transcriptional regulator with XRE-family HTH domain
MNNPFGEILGSDEFREELFIAETQARLSQMLDDKGVSRAELARKLSVSRARVTQIFADDANNLTLKLLARSFIALDEEPLIISKREYEELKAAAAHREVTKAAKREPYRQIDAALIAELLRAHQAFEKSEPEKQPRRAEHTRDWASAGPNIIPFREAANG